MPAPPDPDFRILACSPRPKGNCDAAAGLILGARGDAPASAAVLYLRDWRIEPCIGCGACSRWAEALSGHVSLDHILARPDPGAPFLGCPLSLRDDSRVLLHALATAGGLCFCAPVYFYHLPAQLKALLDRTQPFWALKQAGHALFPTERPCGVVLLGARPKGDKLFEGSLLTLKYALASLNIRPAKPLLLYGLEQPSDLASRGDLSRKTAAYGKTLARGAKV